MDFDRNYQVYGSGDPLIFQHGLGANLGQAIDLLGELDNIKLIAMDCPGHGASVLPANYMPSFNAYTDDVVRLMDHLGIQQALFGGISMGSGISLNMAIRYPERVKGLILVRPAWLESGSPANLMILLDLVKFLEKQEGKAQFERTEGLQNIQSRLPNAAASILGQFARDQQPDTGRILTQMVKDAPFRNREELERIHQPSIVIGNQDDPLHPFNFAEMISEYLPNAKLHKVTSRYLDDAKHRQEVRQIVRSFLKSIDRRNP